MDIAIGNAAEWMTLYETDDLDDALRQAAAVCDIVACTRSGDAVWVQQGDQRFTADVVPVTPVDATGAGDQFAAGFLYGISTGRTLDVAAQMGVLCAAEVIGHIGPRPEVSMIKVFSEHGLI